MVINDVLTKSGLQRYEDSLHDSSDNVVARYQGPPTKGASVSFRNDQLTVQFLEIHRPHVSAPVENITEALIHELKNKSGFTQVQVRDLN